MLQAKDVRIQFLIKALIALIFLSKISLGWLIPLPKDFFFLVFQQGMHPYFNVLMCFLFGVPLLIFSFRVRERNRLSPFYVLFIFVLIVILSLQTFLQIKFVNNDESAFFQIGALATSLFVVLIYGYIIPSLINIKALQELIKAWVSALVIVSVALTPFFGFGLFKGGRFIGIFKHIPHMVTCATVAFSFACGSFLDRTSVKHNILNFFVLVCSFSAIVLTGTRSSLAAAVFVGLMVLLLQRASSIPSQFLKVSMIIMAFVFSVFFGHRIYDYARAVAVGESALGSRQAQDGVASRIEEIQRGTEIFLKQPWFGHGLLSKFSSGNEVDVSNYNAMKDPHNIFVSAGVVGGWPLLFLSFVAMILMIVGTAKALFSKELSQRILAIYLLSHIPILIIYHIHLSIGGMADRLYWLVFGALAIEVSQSKTSRG